MLTDSATQSRRTVLVLEDDPSTNLLQRRHLERAGYRVEQAATVEEAREKIAAAQIDLLILDYKLNADLSGLEFYRELHDTGHAPPAILVTGVGDEAKLAEAMRAGVRDFISKTPDFFERLAPAVDRVMREVCAERQLAEAEAQRKMNERFRVSVENMLEAFGIYTALRDESGRITDFRIDYVNRAGGEMSGVPFEEQRGRRLRELFPALGENGLFEKICAVVETGRPFTAQAIPFEDCVRGGVQWIDLSISKLGDGFTASSRDVTARKQSEDELQRAKIEAEAANQAKDRFLAVLSHELRTPLTPVLAIVSAMENDEHLAPEVRENAATIRRNIELEARLIDDILDLTRIARGKIDLKFQIIDTKSLIDHLQRTFCRHTATLKGVSCRCELNARDHSARVDPARLMQVLWNLLSNAIKFTPSGGIVTVRTRNEQVDDEPWLAIEVTDTGIGIEPAALPQIFTAFEQGDRQITHRYGGLGLGLTISRAIIELHGGTLSAHSQGKGRGSTFTIRLPQKTAVTHGSAQSRSPAGAAPEPSANAAAAAAHLLIVEDHPDTASVLSRMLRRAGYEVTVATGFQSALDAAESAQAAPDKRGRAHPIQLVISDIGLPDGSGRDLMRELKARHGLRGIALSGFGMEEDLRKSREAGFEKHLTKPTDLGSLKLVIREMLLGK